MKSFEQQYRQAEQHYTLGLTHRLRAQAQVEKVADALTTLPGMAAIGGTAFVVGLLRPAQATARHNEAETVSKNTAASSSLFSLSRLMLSFLVLFLKI